jgi:uncharacterized SAM-binding protein YcdF (DUF218 family)
MAICVLGCRPGSAAFTRRARAAADAWLSRGARIVVACGGRAWGGVVEADALAQLLIDARVPAGAVVRERCSLDTRENARFAAGLLARRGIDGVLVVTCSWHLPRALGLFRAAGLRAEGLGVEPPDATFAARAYWASRERVSAWKDARRKVSPA